MIIRCIGHAEFLIELENGMRIVTDPYDASCGYPVLKLSADAVLVSHGAGSTGPRGASGASRCLGSCLLRIGFFVDP